jgi:hypothetical protein
MVLIAGFASGYNNGIFLCVASTLTTLTLLNASCTLEVHAGTAANAYVKVGAIGIANFTNSDCLWICTKAIVAATTISTSGITNPSIAAATFTGVGGIGAMTGQAVTTTPGTSTLTTTKANSMVVSLFLFVSTAGTITASSSSGTLQTNSVSVTNSTQGTAIVTTQATTVGAYTNAVALNRTATTGIVWSIELLPAGSNFNSNLLQLKNAYWDGGQAVTDTWSLQANILSTGPLNQQRGRIATSQQPTQGVGRYVGPIQPAVNALQITYAGEGSGVLMTPPQNVLGSVFLSKLSVPNVPVVTPTGGSATTWNYKVAAFDANGMCTGASANAQITTGAATLTPSAFNTVVISPVTGAAYYALYRAPASGAMIQIAYIPAGSSLTYVDDGSVNGESVTVPSFNWTGGLNFNDLWVGVTPNSAQNLPGALAIVSGSTAFANVFTMYNVTADRPDLNPTLVFAIGYGTTSDANDRIGLSAQAANFALNFGHSRTTLVGDPGITLGGGLWSLTSGAATEIALGGTGGEQVALSKFQPVSGIATYTHLRLTPTINQALAQTNITNISFSNSTTAVLTVTSGTGFTNAAQIVISGCTGTNNAQANGSWVIASGAGTTTITITGSGWSSFTSHAEPTGQLSQQATGAYSMLVVNPTETAVGSPTNGNALLDLQVGGVSKFTVNSKGHINNCNGDVQGHVSSVSGTTVSVTYTTPYTSTPTVTVTPTTNAGAFFLSASSTTGFTITYATSGAQTFNYQVFANGS